MQTTLQNITGVDAFLAAFREHTEARMASEPAWLSAQRRQAIEQFQDQGFPTTRDEEWLYTNVSPLTAIPFRLADGSERSSLAAAHYWDGPVAARLVFINGKYQADLSALSKLPAGTVIGSLSELLSNPRSADTLRVYFGRANATERHPFAALNTALWQDGPCVLIPAGVALTEPIHLVHIVQTGAAPFASHPRTLVVCQHGSQLTLVETYQTADNGIALTNALTEILASEDSVIDLYTSTRSNSRSFHIGLLNVYAGRGAQISAFSASLGGELIRNEAHVLLDAEGADCTLHGLYTAKGVQHVDNHTTIDHAKPNCSSRQFYNGILDGHATGVFNGRVIVRPNAQKTDAVQKNRNLLLSTDATIDTKPQLEISANDVRCTHGATVGQLDQEALFFLQARGLNRDEAVGMLVRAFASEILDKVKISNYRDWLAKELSSGFLGDDAAGKRI